MKEKAIQSTDYLNQVCIPEGKSGSYAIEHFTYPAGKELCTANLRHAMMSMGAQKIKKVVYDSPTKWHRLTYERGVWMTDIPSEQEQHRKLLEKFEGHVLVGGLGLGLAANWLAKRKHVKSVTVVEVSEEVIELVQPHIRDPRKIVNVVHADLLEFLRRRGLRYDWAFYDIWQSDGEGTFFDTVIPLRELSAGHVCDTSVVCWNEDVMRGQLFFSLQQRFHSATSDPSVLEKFTDPAKRCDKWIGWSMDFLDAVKGGKVTSKNVYRLAALYSQHFGRPTFNAIWKYSLRYETNGGKANVSVDLKLSERNREASGRA
jgi:hypothetical protein